MILIPGYFLNKNSFKKIEGKRYEYGIFEKEKIKKKKMRWTMKMSGSNEFAKSDYFGIEVYAKSQKSTNKKLQMDLFINNVKIDRVSFSKTGLKDFYYHIPGIKNKYFMLKTKVNYTFNPYKNGLNKSMKMSREQGVALGKVRYFNRLPKKKFKTVDNLL